LILSPHVMTLALSTPVGNMATDVRGALTYLMLLRIMRSLTVLWALIFWSSGIWDGIQWITGSYLAFYLIRALKTSSLTTIILHWTPSRHPASWETDATLCLGSTIDYRCDIDRRFLVVCLQFSSSNPNFSKPRTRTANSDFSSWLTQQLLQRLKSTFPNLQINIPKKGKFWEVGAGHLQSMQDSSLEFADEQVLREG
jgi:hypothetical protein